LTISFWVQCLQSHQSILIPFCTPCPYKTQFSPPSFPYPWALAPPPPPRTSSTGLLTLAHRGRRTLLPSVSCSTRGSHLPCRLVASSPVKDWAHGWRGRPRGGLPAGFANPHPRLEGGGGDVKPSPTSLLQSCLEGGSGDATQCRDDVDAIRFTLVSFYFSTYILIKPFM
jgi:hypothetical protein